MICKASGVFLWFCELALWFTISLTVDELSAFALPMAAERNVCNSWVTVICLSRVDMLKVLTPGFLLSILSLPLSTPPDSSCFVHLICSL